VQLLIDQPILNAALQAIGRIVPRRPVVQGLGAVLLKAEGERLELAVTDLEGYAKVALAAGVHAPGAASVEWQHFARVVAALPSGQVALSVSGSNRSLRITCGPSAFRLRTMSVEDFPLLEPPQTWGFSISAEELADMIARATFCAVDSDEGSPFFGVSVSVEASSLKLAATDNLQLAYYVRPVESLWGAAAPGGFATVVPTRGLNAFVRALGPLGDSRVDFALTERRLWFRSGELVWSVRALDTRYPDLTRYTGRLGGVRVVTSRSLLLEAVRQVSSLSDEGKSTVVRLEGTRLHLASSHPEVGEAQTVVPLGAEYPKRIVWLNANRFQNALRAQPADEIALYLSEPLAPVAVVPADESIGFRSFLTPLRYPAEESEAI